MILGIIQKVLNIIPINLRSKIKDIPAVKHVQAFIIRQLLNNAEFNAEITEGPAKGLIFPVKLPQDKLMWVGTWELEFAKALQNAVKPGFVCYDIGGYKGYYSGVMALKGASEVIVFEPVPQNTEKIKQLIALNPKLPIRLQECAVSNHEGTATFKLMNEDTMGKLEGSSFQKTEQSVNEFEVRCITLDGIVEKGTPLPDLIKIDVEGAEELVLKGSVNLLKEKRPYLMIEIHSSEIGKQCCNLLEEYYHNITVFETKLPPQNGEPEICHYIAY